MKKFYEFLLSTRISMGIYVLHKDWRFPVRRHVTFAIAWDYDMGLDTRKTCLRVFANNKGADQPAHPRRLIRMRRLISAFVIRFLETVI